MHTVSCRVAVGEDERLRLSTGGPRATKQLRLIVHFEYEVGNVAEAHIVSHRLLAKLKDLRCVGTYSQPGGHSPLVGQSVLFL